MQTFELYGVAWFLYLLLGIALLVLVNLKTKQLSWNKRFALLSFLAVGALTPDIVVNSDTYAPLIVTSLLNAEVEGVSAIISGFIKLFIIWGIVFFSLLAIHHFWLAKNKTKQAEVPNE